MQNEGIIFFIVIAVLILIVCFWDRSPQEKIFLKDKITKLGNLTNYTYSRLVSHLGEPDKIKKVKSGKYVTWQDLDTSTDTQISTRTYTITLKFDANNQCLGIASENYSNNLL
jgi:hypothetical protein